MEAPENAPSKNKLLRLLISRRHNALQQYRWQEHNVLYSSNTKSGRLNTVILFAFYEMINDAHIYDDLSVIISVTNVPLP